MYYPLYEIIERRERLQNKGYCTTFEEVEEFDMVTIPYIFYTERILSFCGLTLVTLTFIPQLLFTISLLFDSISPLTLLTINFFQ